MLQKQLLNCSSLESTNSAMIHSGSRGVTAQTAEDRKRLLQNTPLLLGLLTENPTKKVCLPTLSSPSERKNGKNCRHPTTQNRHSSGTQKRPHQQQYITSSVSSQRDLPVGKTDEQILDHIKVKLKLFKTQIYNEHKNKNERLNFNHTDSLKSSSKSDTSAHSTSFNSDEERRGLDCAVTEHYSSTLGPRREVDSSEGSEATPAFAVKSDVTGSCATSAPEQHPTEYPQIMQKVAGSHTKNEDEVPVVLTTFSRMTVDKLLWNHPGSRLNCSSSEEYKTPWLNTNNNLDNVDRMPGVSWSLMSEKKRGTVPEATEVGQVDYVEDYSMDPSLRSSMSRAFKVVREDVKASKPKNTEEHHQLIQHTGSKYESQADKIQMHDVKGLLEQSREHYNQNHSEDKQDTVCSGFVLFESKAKGREPLPESKVEVFCKNPYYEDISDEEQPCMVTQVTKTKHGGSDVLISCRDPQYEDISEDDHSQNTNFDLEIQMAEPDSVQSPLENVGFTHKQGQAEMKADNISVEDHAPELPGEGQKCCCPYYVETEHGFESTLCPKCERHLEQQKDQPIVCSSLSDQQNEDADDQNSDSESDDDFLVFSLIPSSLKFESDEIHKSKEIVILSDDETSETEDEGRRAGTCSTHTDLHHPVSIPQPANSIEIYGTLESYLREQNLERFRDRLAADSNVVSDKITSECEMSSSGSMPHPTVTSETEGSSETDDSCNYSSDPESNYLTVSKCLLMKGSSPGPVETDDSLSAAEDELNGDMNGHSRKAMACPTSKAGLAMKSPFMQKLGELINTKSRLKRNQPKANKQSISKQNDTIDSESEDESGQNYKEMKKTFSSRSDAANTQHHGHPPKVEYSQIYHAQIEDTMNDDSSGLTNTTEKTRHLAETNASSKHVSHKTDRRKILENERSDCQDRGDRNLKKVKRKSSSSELGETGKAQRRSPEPVYIQSKTGKEKVKKSMQSSANLSHRQNKVYDLQLGDMAENARSDLSNSGQRIKANVVSKHRQKTSEDKSFLLNSEPKRHSAETVNQLCGASGKPSENSAEKPQSVAIGSCSKLFSRPIVPHLVVNKSSDHCDVLNLSDKDKTGTLRTTGAESSKKHKLKHLNKSEKGSRDQTSKARRLSLPNHPSTSENNYESRNRSAYFSRGLSHDAEMSGSSNELIFEQNPSIPKQRSSTLQQSHYSSVSHHHGPHSCSVSPPSMQTSAKQQVTESWNNSYFPTRRDKKNLGAEEDTTSNSIFAKNTSAKLHQESRPRRSHERVRQRNNSHEMDPPLMKRAKDDFRKFKEGRIRDPSTEQSRNVGKGYKWKEKPPATKL